MQDSLSCIGPDGTIHLSLNMLDDGLSAISSIQGRPLTMMQAVALPDYFSILMVQRLRDLAEQSDSF